MSEHNSAVPPPLLQPEVKPKKKWRWFKILAGTTLGVVLLVKIVSSYNPVELELALKGANSRDDGKAVELTNVGAKPIALTKITINDRADCVVSTMGQTFDRIGRIQSGAKPDPSNDQFKGATLGVGDKTTYISSCRIIRATIETDGGTNSYTFK